MVTMVGTQKDFGNSMLELLELEYAAVEAYELPISKIEKDLYKEHLKEFKNDHLHHIKQLSKLLQKHDYEVPKLSDTPKGLLTKGKVVLANLMGDEAILSAMLSNEEDTNTAYKKMNERTDIWDDAIDVLQQSFEDEKRHKKWLEKQKA